MFATPRLVTATPLGLPARAERTRRLRRPRTLAAAAVLIGLLALTAGGPLVVVSTAPTVDLSPVPAAAPR